MKSNDLGWLRRLVSIALVCIAALSGAVVTAPAAQAVTCYGDYCSGRDPEATGCSADAYTVVSARIPGTSAHVELRWSPTCRSNWARTAWNGSNPGSALRAVQCPTNYTQGYSGTNGSFWWSRMIYSPNLGVSAQWNGPPGSVGTSCA
jgi:hypothetical protein